MKLTTTLLCAALLAALSACKSTKDESYSDHDLPCICGSADAAIDGCHYPACRDGIGNPDNEDCVCGPLAFESEDD